MYNRFKELGIPVKITRTTDETISPKDRTNEILSMYGNDPNVLVISNHINAGGEKDSCSKITFFEICVWLYQKYVIIVTYDSSIFLFKIDTAYFLK